MKEAERLNPKLSEIKKVGEEKDSLSVKFLKPTYISVKAKLIYKMYFPALPAAGRFSDIYLVQWV